MMVSIHPHTYRHLIRTIVLILASLIIVSWYPIVVLICISQMTNYKRGEPLMLRPQEFLPPSSSPHSLQQLIQITMQVFLLGLKAPMVSFPGKQILISVSLWMCPSLQIWGWQFVLRLHLVNRPKKSL